MNTRDIERLSKETLYTFLFNSKMKDTFISKDLHELSQVIKKTIKYKDCYVFVIEKNY